MKLLGLLDPKIPVSCGTFNGTFWYIVLLYRMFGFRIDFTQQTQDVEPMLIIGCRFLPCPPTNLPLTRRKCMSPGCPSASPPPPFHREIHCLLRPEVTSQKHESIPHRR